MQFGKISDFVLYFKASKNCALNGFDKEAA